MEIPNKDLLRLIGNIVGNKIGILRRMFYEKEIDKYNF